MKPDAGAKARPGPHSLERHPDLSERNLGIAFFLNFFFTLLELLGGLLTNSMAIFSGALHDLSDSISLGVAFFLQRLSKKKRDKSFSYGYRRFSLIGALITSGVLLAGSVLILYNSIPRLLDPESVNAKGMIVFGVLGIIINGLGVLVLRRGKSFNERTAWLHLLGDMFGWGAVLVTSIIMLFVDLPILDPILSILITIYILFNIVTILKGTFKVLMQSTPASLDIEDVTRRISKMKDVVDVHDMHLWTLDGEYNVLTVHVVVTGACTMAQAEEVKARIKKVLKGKPIHHMTIEVETEGGTCELHTC